MLKMVKKLSFLLTDKTWKSLLLKVLFLALVYSGFIFFDFSFPVIFVFSILVGWFYFFSIAGKVSFPNFVFGFSFSRCFFFAFLRK